MGTSAFGNSGEGVHVTIGGTVTGLVAAMGQGAAAVRTGTASMEASLTGLATTVSAAMAPLLAITALLGGATLFGTAITQTVQLADELSVLSEKTNVEVEALSSLKYAAEQSDASFEMLSGGLTKLARTMEGAVEAGSPAAKALGSIQVAAVDAEGKLRPMDEVLLDIADRFSGMENGAKKSAIAMDLFGKSGSDLIPFLNEGREGITALREEAERLGITMSTQDVAAAKAYGDSMDKLNSVLASVGREIVLGLMPALTALSDWFSEKNSQPAAYGDGMVRLRDVFKGIGVEITAIVFGTSALVSALQAVGAATTLQFDKARQYLADARADLEQIAKVYKSSFFTGGATTGSGGTGAPPPTNDDKADAEAQKTAERLQRALEQSADIMTAAKERWRAENAKAEKELGESWVRTLDAIPRAWSSAMSAMTDSTQGWGDFVREMLRGLAADFAAYIARTLIMDNAAMLERVKNRAIEAAAGAYAAIAGIPVVGPVLAPLAAVAALAGVLALAHGGGGGGGSSAGGAPTANAPTRGSSTTIIYAMDARSFQDFAMRNTDTFARATMAGASNGVRMPTSPGRG